MSLLGPARPTFRRLNRTIIGNPLANLEALADSVQNPEQEPRGDVIRRHITTRIHGAGGEGEREPSRPTFRRWNPARNLLANIEALADSVQNPEQEPRGDVIWRHLTTRIHGAGGEGEREGEDFCAGLCVICHTEFSDGERVCVLECHHEYHATCIHTWLMRRNRCPLCQRIAIRDLG